MSGMKNPRAAGTVRGTSENVLADSSDDSTAPASPSTVAARLIAIRFGLLPATARAVVALAGLGGAAHG